MADDVVPDRPAVFAELSPPYATIVADPPWAYPEGFAGGHSGSRTNPSLPPGPVSTKPLPYSCMSVDSIKALDVRSLSATDCRLFLWTTNRYLRHSWSVVESWGFEPMTRVFVWCKQPMGTANVTTEFVLVGKRGKPPRLPWHNSTWFAWPRQHHAHSQKPDAFLDLVEQWSPGPYVELFSRRPRFGWDSWGKGYESVAVLTGQEPT